MDLEGHGRVPPSFEVVEAHPDPQVFGPAEVVAPGSDALEFSSCCLILHVMLVTQRCLVSTVLLNEGACIRDLRVVHHQRGAGFLGRLCTNPLAKEKRLGVPRRTPSNALSLTSVCVNVAVRVWVLVLPPHPAPSPAARAAEETEKILRRKTRDRPPGSDNPMTTQAQWVLSQAVKVKDNLGVDAGIRLDVKGRGSLRTLHLAA